MATNRTTLLQFVNAMTTKAPYVFATVCRGVIAALDAPLSAMDKARMVAEFAPAGIANRVTWVAEDNTAAHRHLRQICTRVITTTERVVDVEGCIFGKMFGSADLVEYNAFSNTFVLVDYTSDNSLRSSKLEALGTTISSLKAMFPAARLVAEVRPVTVEQEMCEPAEPRVTPCDARTRFKFDFVDALSSFSITADAFDDAFSAIAMTQMPREPKLKCHYAASVAGGSNLIPNVKAVLDSARLSYPKTVKKLLSIFSTKTSFTRGIAPPRMDATPFQTGGTLGWFLSVLRSAPEGSLYRWTKGEAPILMAPGTPMRKLGLVMDDDGPDVEATVIGDGFVRLSVSASAIKSLVDLVERPVKVKDREWATTAELSTYEAARRFYVAETKLENFSAYSAPLIPRLLDRAKKLMDNASHVGTVNGFAAREASRSLATCDTTIASAMLSVARIIASSALAAARSKGEHTFRVMSYASGTIMCIAKVTGPLEKENSTSVVACIANPVEVVGSWESERDRKEAITKALFMSRSAANWYSEAPGAVVALYTAYQDARPYPQTDDPAYVASASLVALANRKPLNVALCMERHYATTSVSLESDFDELAEKTDIATLLTDVEKLLVFRMIVRGLATALERDTLDLTSVVKVAADGRKSVVYCPIFTKGISVSIVGIVNSFYDGSLASGDFASHLRAAGIATVAAVEASEDIRRREEEGDPTTWCANPLAVAAWRREQAGEAGALEAYIGSESFLQDEVKFAIEIGQRKAKYVCSLTAIYAYAKEMGCTTTYNDEAFAVASSTSLGALTTKKCLDSEKLLSEPSTDYAFSLNMRSMVRRAAGANATVNQHILPIISTHAGAHLSASMSSLALETHFWNGPFRALIMEKMGSIEKPRDIGLIDEMWRHAQRFIDSISYSVGKACPNSALMDKSKIRVIEAMTSKMGEPAPGYISLKIATDKTRYGPSKEAAAFYAAVVAVGCEGDLRVYYRDFLVRISEKRMRPCDALMAASIEDLRFGSVPGEPGGSPVEGLIELIRYAKSQYDHCVPVKVGMFQGLLQGTADVLTSASTSATKRVLARVFRRAEFVTTNDDGAGEVHVRADAAWDSATKIKTICSLTGYATGEMLNSSKLVITTVAADLNTQLMVSGNPVLPYVRTLMKCASGSSAASPSESALAVMNSTNQAVIEGAPLWTMFTALAVSWACHYERFRMIEEAIAGNFPTKKILMLGPPAFFPTIAYALGGSATVGAVDSIRAGSSIIDSAYRAVASLAARAPDPTRDYAWADDQRAPTEGFRTTRYVMASAPIVKLVKCEALPPRSAPSVRFLDYSVVAHRLSIAGTILPAIRAVQDSLSQDAFKTSSILVAEAATQFTLEKQRVVAVETMIGANGRSTSTRTLTYLAMIEEMKSADMTADPSVDVLARLAAVSNLVKSSYAALEAIRAMDVVTTLTVAKRTTAMTRSYYVEDRVGEQTILSYAVEMAAPSVKGSVTAAALREGVVVGKPSLLVDDASEADVAEALMAGRRVALGADTRISSPAIVPAEVSMLTREELASVLASANIGFSLKATTVTVPAGVGSVYIAGASREAARRSDLGRIARQAIDAALHYDMAFPTYVSDVAQVITCAQDLTASYQGPGIGQFGIVQTEEVRRLIEGMCIDRARITTMGDFMGVITRTRCSGILRRGELMKAVGRERKVVITRGDRATVKYLGVRMRENNLDGCSYSYKVVLYVTGPTCNLTITRGDSTATTDEAGVAVMSKGMTVEVRNFGDCVSFSVAMYPPACVLVVDRDKVMIPLYDVRMVSTVTGPVIPYAPNDFRMVARSALDNSPEAFMAKYLAAIAASNPLVSKAFAVASISTPYTDIMMSFVASSLDAMRRTTRPVLSISEAGAFESARQWLTAGGDAMKVAAIMVGLEVGMPNPTTRKYWSGMVQSLYDGESISYVTKMIWPREQAHTDWIGDPFTDPFDESGYDVNGDFDDDEEVDALLAGELEMAAIFNAALGMPVEETLLTAELAALGVMAEEGTGQWVGVVPEDTMDIARRSRVAAPTTSELRVPSEVLSACASIIAHEAIAATESRARQGLAYGPMSTSELFTNSIRGDIALASHASDGTSYMYSLLLRSSYTIVAKAARQTVIRRNATNDKRFVYAPGTFAPHSIVGEYDNIVNLLGGVDDMSILAYMASTSASEEDAMMFIEIATGASWNLAM